MRVLYCWIAQVEVWITFMYGFHTACLPAVPFNGFGSRYV